MLGSCWVRFDIDSGRYFLNKFKELTTFVQSQLYLSPHLHMEVTSK